MFLHNLYYTYHSECDSATASSMSSIRSTLPGWEDIETLLTGKSSTFADSMHPAPSCRLQTEMSGERGVARNGSALPKQETESPEQKHNYSSSNTAYDESTKQSKHSSGYISRTRNSSDEIFLCRESFLGFTDLVKSLTDHLVYVENFVENEADLPIKVVSGAVAFSSRVGGLNRCAPIFPHRKYIKSSGILPFGVPKEAVILEDAYIGLETALLSCLQTVSGCFETRKAMYFKEVTKYKEISNRAIRNAAQYERGAADISMSNLREALERRNIEDTNELNRRLQEMQARFQNLEQHCKDLEDHVRELEEKEARRVAMQEEAVIKATNELRQEIDEESKHTRSLMLAENKRVNEDAHNQIQLNNRRFEAQLEAMKVHENEIRQILTSERNRLEAGCVELRTKLSDAIAQASCDRDRYSARMAEDRQTLEREHQLALSEAVSEQSKLHAEMSAMVQRFKAEDTKRLNELDLREARFRESVINQNEKDSTKMMEKHRAEIKCIKADMEVHHNNAIVSLRRSHEQELNRLLRDRDRLQNIIIRNGGASMLGPLSTPDRMAPSSKSSQFAPVLPSLHGTSSSSSPPPAPPPQKRSPFSAISKESFAELEEVSTKQGTTTKSEGRTDMSTSGGGRAAKRPTLNWGTLTHSLQKEETALRQRNLKSSRDDLPTTFLLDESFEATKNGKSSNSGLGVGANAYRVGKYMNQLESYLEGVSATHETDGGLLRDEDAESLEDMIEQDLGSLPVLASAAKSDDDNHSGDKDEDDDNNSTDSHNYHR